MKKITTFLTFLFFTFLVGCGAQSTNAITSNVSELDTSDVITRTTSTTTTGTNLCGNIYSYTLDYFNILFKFYSTTGATYNIVAGDTATQSLLNQMPANVFANNVCVTAVISGSTATISNITQ